MSRATFAAEEWEKRLYKGFQIVLEELDFQEETKSETKPSETMTFTSTKEVGFLKKKHNNSYVKIFRNYWSVSTV